MYTQLPDYDDCQGYDRGVCGNLSQVDRGIYANFHKPSWQTWKHHLLTAKNRKESFRELKSVAGNGKNGDFEQERMFGRVAKIPIADTFSELVEMDFADYGDFAALLRIQGALSRFSVIAFIGAKRQEGQTSEMVR